MQEEGGRGGGEFPADRCFKYLFVEMYFRQHHPVIDGTVGPCALFLEVQSAASETHGPISGEVCGVSVSVALGAVGLCVEVLQPNVFLFQRDFFTVCFSPTLCVRARKAFCILGGGQRAERNLGASQRHTEATSPRFSFFFAADITTYPTAQEYWPRSQSLLLRPLCIVVRISKWHFPLMN